MDITIKHFDGQHPQFNVMLHVAPGSEPFLEIKGCRIVEGKNGPFVSWPATKNEKTGKYWNHVYAGEKFAAAVLKKAQEGQRKAAPKGAQGSGFEDFEDAPF